MYPTKYILTLETQIRTALPTCTCTLHTDTQGTKGVLKGVLVVFWSPKFYSVSLYGQLRTSYRGHFHTSASIFEFKGTF